MEQEEIKENFRQTFKHLDRYGNRITAIETGNTLIQASLDERLRHMSSRQDSHEDRIRGLEDRQTRLTVKLSLIGGGIYLVITLLAKWI